MFDVVNRVNEVMNVLSDIEIPLNELVISPAAIFESELLEEVSAN